MLTKTAGTCCKYSRAKPKRQTHASHYHIRTSHTDVVIRCKKWRYSSLKVYFVQAANAFEESESDKPIIAAIFLNAEAASIHCQGLNEHFAKNANLGVRNIRFQVRKANIVEQADDKE
jgi:hypothetical protein